MTFEQFQEIVVAKAKEAGLEAYELYFAKETSKSVSALAGKVAETSSDVEMGATFRCVCDGKMGYCSTELLTKEEAERIVLGAMENAKVLETSDAGIIFRGSESYEKVENKPLPEVDLTKAALSLQEKTLAMDPRVQPMSRTSASEGEGTIALVNSFGLKLTNTFSQQALFQTAIVREGEEQFNDHAFSEKPIAQEDLDELAKKAVEGAVDKINSGKVSSGKYKIVFEGKAFASLLGAFSSIFSAKAAQQGMSLLKGKEGERVAAPCVSLVDDPFCQDSPKTSFDAEGVATSTKCVIEKGVFKTLLYNLETAQKAGVESTGNASRASYSAPIDIAPFTFYIAPGELKEEALLAKVGEGILITDMAGLHAGLNPISGDFSLSSSGYRISGGKKEGFVNEFTISGNFFELLKGIEALSDEVKFGFPRGFSRVGAPMVFAGELSVAGK